MMKKLEQEINDILCRELYMAYHEEVGGVKPPFSAPKNKKDA